MYDIVWCGDIASNYGVHKKPRRGQRVQLFLGWAGFMEDRPSELGFERPYFPLHITQKEQVAWWNENQVKFI